jgi:eukaryotic-like serine/threonine-protein kinase
VQTPSIVLVDLCSEQEYALGRTIACGGMATVHEGTAIGPLGFKHRVAIKVCHPHLMNDKGRRDAVMDEARIAARIRHPNIVTTLDVVQGVNGAVMIVMELVDGMTASELLASVGERGERLPIELVLRIVLDIASGLHAAHELTDEDGTTPLSIVHRDVTPSNILLGRDGFAKLADFGIFKGVGRDAESTEEGCFKGKIGYIAPEIFRGERPTRQVDIYGLGVVLWELLAGERLFNRAGGNEAAMMMQVLRGEIRPLRSLREDASPELEAVVLSALASDPAARFQTAEDFARAIEALPYSAASSRTLRHYVNDALTARLVAIQSVITPRPRAHVLLPTIDFTSQTLLTSVVAEPKSERGRVAMFIGVMMALCIFASIAILVLFAPKALASPSPSSSPPPPTLDPPPPPPSVAPPAMPQPMKPKKPAPPASPKRPSVAPSSGLFDPQAP